MQLGASSVAKTMTLSSDSLLQQAIIHHQAGRTTEAEALYQAALLAEPGNPEILHNFGLLLLQCAEPVLALPYFNAALEAQSQNPQCWLSYADCLLAAGWVEDAQQVILAGRAAGLEGVATDLLEARITAAWISQPNLARLYALAENGQFHELALLAQEQIGRFGEKLELMDLLAQALIALGRDAEALLWLEKTCLTTPTNKDALIRCGLVLKRLKDFETAYRVFLKALRLAPGDANTLFCLGQNLYDAGFFEEARIWLRLAVLLGVGSWSAWLLLVDILKEMGLSVAAHSAFESQMTAQQPPSRDTAAELLAVLEAGVDVTLLRRPKKRLARGPGAEKRNQMMRLFASNQLEQLGAMAQELCEEFPLDPFGWKVLGAVLKVSDKDQLQALTAMQLGAAADPEDAEAHNNLANLLLDMQRFFEAELAAKRALLVKPKFAPAYLSLASALVSQEKFSEAKDVYRKALSFSSFSSHDLANGYCSLGFAEFSLGEIDLAISDSRRATEIDPCNAPAFSNFLFMLSHSEGVTPLDLFAEHRRFGDLFERELRDNWPEHINTRDQARCLKIGFVSADLYTHAVANFIEPIFIELAKSSSLSLHVYHTRKFEDETSRRLRTYVQSWHRASGLSAADLAKRIQGDGIDILIDLSGHTGINALLTFARKPAPIQISWIGYPGTTGLQAMDYYLADRFFLPPGRYDNQFTEKLVYLPSSSIFQPFEDAPLINDLPAFSLGHLTFGSFNRINKINASTIALWSQLLRALPDAKMLLGGLPPECEFDQLINLFAQEGIACERLRFHARSDMFSYLELHHQVDICLDTYPYAGGTTTYHALWMGVPTLTVAGATPAGRSGASILAHVGLDEFVAKDAADFVEKGKVWAGNLRELAGLRSGLRARCEQSDSRNPDLIAANFERALRIMWQRWCSGLPAESFEILSQDVNAAQWGEE